MDAVKNPDSWRSIAYWLNVEELVALLVTGNRWMIAVLSTSPDLVGSSKFYPIASILVGMREWKIPRLHPIHPNHNGVVGPFPPRLTSLSLTPGLMTSTSKVILPATLTDLAVGKTEGLSMMGVNWAVWKEATRGLSQLEALDVDYYSPTEGYAVVEVPYPNLTSLSVRVLNNKTSVIKLSDLIPLSLTQLKISDVITINSELEDVIPMLANLLSLTIPSFALRKPDHYTMRHLPAQLTELSIKDKSVGLGVDRTYYLPEDVIKELPRTITSLDVMIISRDQSLEALTRLPLKILKLITRSNMRTGTKFEGTFPNLVELNVTNFNMVVVPSSVTELHVLGNREVNIPIEAKLRKLDIHVLPQLTDYSSKMAIFRNLTSFSMDFSIEYVPVSTFMSWLNPDILQSLTMGVAEVSTALDILRWTATYAHNLTEFTLYNTRPLQALTPYPTRDELDARAHDVGDHEFDLPVSLTSLHIVFHKENKLKLNQIPPHIVRLHLSGIIVDVSQLSALTLLEQLTIASETIMGVVYVDPVPNWRLLELHMMTFMMALPKNVARVVVSREQLENKSNYPGVHSTTPRARYDFKEWLHTPCNKRDARTVVSKMMVHLIPSYPK